MVGLFALFTHQLKLKSSKQVCLFGELTSNLSLLVTHCPFLEFAMPLDKATIRGFEHDADVYDSLTSFSSFDIDIDVERRWMRKRRQNNAMMT